MTFFCHPDCPTVQEWIDKEPEDRMSVDDDDLIVIHNSMDERESYEEGRKPQ